MGSVVVEHGFGCPEACGILVPRPGIKPMSFALAGGFLSGPPGKCITFLLFKFPVCDASLQWPQDTDALTHQAHPQAVLAGSG